MVGVRVGVGAGEEICLEQEKSKMTVSGNLALFEKKTKERGEENNLVHNDCLKLMPHQ